ncbi:unnamed protein product [Strongylus vulgaris]|uniref:Uncharacterized protein n=1 Tax=Strongylus vulgaris TaxID=40348 RepID=A0A3P7J3X8_STRVU|nr:unnamed protein product [Strongylus vulgaris]
MASTSKGNCYDNWSRCTPQTMVGSAVFCEMLEQTNSGKIAKTTVDNALGNLRENAFLLVYFGKAVPTTAGNVLEELTGNAKGFLLVYCGKAVPTTAGNVLEELTGNAKGYTTDTVVEATNAIAKVIALRNLEIPSSGLLADLDYKEHNRNATLSN